MKTKTFIKRLEDELGYVTDKSGNFINIRKEHGELGGLFAMVAINKVLGIDTSFHNFTSLDKHDQDLLFDLIQEYARTPLEEREEEKEYVYRMNCAVVAQEYLKATKKGVVRFEGARDFSTNEPYFKSKFTDAEVESYPEEVLELFKICEKIEVTP